MTTPTPEHRRHALHLGIAEAGKVHALARRHREALERYREAMRMAEVARAPQVFARHYLYCMLDSLEHLGALDNVAEISTLAAEATREAGDSPFHRRDRAGLLERLGVIRLKQGDTVAAQAALIEAVGRGVAEAQAALDRGSLEATLAVYDTEGHAGAQLLREIGYRPTFYVLPETSCEVQVSMRVGGRGGADGSAKVGARTYVTPLDAGFANRFSYAANASARLTFRIVPVPSPAALDENRPAPNLIGLWGSEAAAKLELLGLSAAFVDADGAALTDTTATTAKVTGQLPAALGLVPLGESVRLVMK